MMPFARSTMQAVALNRRAAALQQHRSQRRNLGNERAGQTDDGKQHGADRSHGG
jgi:hypothetical protein